MGKKPKARQVDDLVGPAALSDGVLGFPLRSALLCSLLGAAGAAAVRSLRHVGIDEDFIKQVKTSVIEGTSALFLLSSSGVGSNPAAFVGVHSELIATNLTGDQEAKLREVFAQ